MDANVCSPSVASCCSVLQCSAVRFLRLSRTIQYYEGQVMMIDGKFGKMDVRDIKLDVWFGH